jgi:eukaryotic-like serine/threonine-protein kinase
MMADTVPEELGFPQTERFDIRRRIGAGGMGVVYEAFDRHRNAQVAVKTLLQVTAQTLYRFKQEFRAVQELAHPNLVRLGELICADGLWFFTMELVAGTDFLSFVRGPRAARADGPRETATVPAGPVPTTKTVPAAGNVLGPAGATTFATNLPADLSPRTDVQSHGDCEQAAAPGRVLFDEEKLVDGLRQLALGLHALHSAHKVHRDIKPSNVLVTSDQRVVILDFGILAETGAGAPTAAHLGDSSQALATVHASGTPAYMAPEQIRGHVTAAADWYAVGVLLYESLVGHRPFRGSPRQILEQKQSCEPPPPRALNPAIPPALSELCAALLRRAPQDRPGGDDILEQLGVPRPARTAVGPSSLPDRDGAPFVGRIAELSQLRSAYEDRGRDEWCTVFVHGQSGVGKSELVRRFVAEQTRADPKLLILSGRCNQRERIPFQAFDGIADSLSRFLRRSERDNLDDLLPPEPGLLAELFPVLDRVEPIAQAPREARGLPDPRVQRARRFAAFRKVLRRLSEIRPLILVVDDLQWMDDDSFALLKALMRPPASPALLFVATIRVERPGQEPVEVLPAAGQLEGAIRHLRVDELPPEQARELIALLAPDFGRDDRARADAIIREAGGHPLFLHELTLYAHRRAERPDAAPLLDEALWARVQELPDQARHLLHVLCLAGAPVSYEVLRSAAQIEYAPAERDIQFLRAHNLLRSTGMLRGDKLEPFHDRITESVIARLEPSTKKAHHAALASAFEQSGAADSDPQVLVRHLEAGGDARRAAEFAEKAAARAETALALAQAADLYRTALRLGGYAGEKRRDLQLRLAHTLINDGRNAEAPDLLIDAAQGASPELRLACQCLAAEKLLTTGHLSRGEALIREVLAEIGETIPATPLRALTSLLWNRFKLRMRPVKWDQATAAPLDPETRKRLDIYRAAADGFGVVDPVRGNDFQTRGLLLALRSRNSARIGRALAYDACFVATRGGPRNARRADELLAMALTLAQATADEGVASWVDGATVVVDSLLERDRRAAERGAAVEETLATLRGVGRGSVTQIVMGGWEMATVQQFRMLSLRVLGEYRQLRDVYQRWLRDAVERGDLYSETNLRRLFNSIHLIDDDLERARRELRKTTWCPPEGRLHVQHYYELRATVEHALYEGSAADHVPHFEARFQELKRSLLHRVTRLRADMYRLRSSVAVSAAASARDPRPYLKIAEQCARRLKPIPSQSAQRTRTQVLAALALHHGDMDRACGLLQRAIRDSEALGVGSENAALRWRYAALVGGDEGAAEARRASAWFDAQGIKNRARWAELTAPGLIIARLPPG